MTALADAVTTIHTRYLGPRVLMLLFTLEASAVTNLLTSLAGGGEPRAARVVLWASVFYLVAASYALAAEGLLGELLDVASDFDDYRMKVSSRAIDLIWWLIAHAAAVIYGTTILWPING